MEPARIFYPMVALAGLTFGVLLLIPFARAGRGLAAQSEFHEPARDAGALLCRIALYVTRTAESVALRAAHSLVHLAYNNLFHRLGVYALSNVVLIVLWMRWAMALK